MSPSPSVSVILPAYNEAARILGTLREIQDYFRAAGRTYEIIVAADGNDGTREKAHEAAKADPNVFVLGGVERLGKGRGVRLGVGLARGEVVGFMDADNKTPVTELDKFLPLLAGGHDLVIGSRTLQRGLIERPQPFYRRVGSHGFRVVLRALIGLHEISDTQCGFKFFRREAARAVFERQRVDGYMFDVEILRIAQLLGLKIAQVPVRWRDDADSRLELVAGNLRNLRDLLRIRFGTG
ncbi:MAG: dolichyl-phosphate beta-glucosyltransferase [Elusimicrobiota bacterium]|jgi:dolichyl-phosphate beta-glucosyltransferase